MKRLQNKGQVQYSYDVPPDPEGPTLPQEEDDEPYTPRQELDIPVNMIFVSVFCFLQPV